MRTISGKFVPGHEYTKPLFHSLEGNEFPSSKRGNAAKPRPLFKKERNLRVFAITPKKAKCCCGQKRRKSLRGADEKGRAASELRVKKK